MIKGLYAAATGMMALEARHAIISNNIANAATPGFRRQEAVVKGFYDVFLSELGTVARYNRSVGPGGGVEVEQTFTTTHPGTIATTGNPLDVALEGPGFFAVDTPLGERFTRNGKFTVSADGQLTTPEGYAVQGAGGPLDVTGSQVEINTDGTVRVDGEVVGRLRIVEFADTHMLERQGENLFFANDAAIAQSAEGATTRVEGNSLELSNVQVPLELANVMIGLRAYAANQKVIQTLSDTMGRVINQVGSPL